MTSTNSRRGGDDGRLERPSSIDVEVATSITSIGEGDLRYRGLEVPELARVATFEQVATLLWTGQLGDRSEAWQPKRGVVEAREAVARLPRDAAPAWRVAAAVTDLAVRDPLRHDRAPAAVADLGRHLIAAIVRALHPPRRSAGPSVASQLAVALTPRPDDALVRTIDRALALLADHELASSTLAVRIAASTWADPYACVLTGLGVLSGPLHGGASRAHHQLLVECEARGVEVVVGEHLRAGEKLPGFGHKIYREDDPRVAPLRELLADFGSPVRWELVDELLALTSARLTVRPNVDSALGALSFVAGLPADTGELMFAVARIAGWLAHAIEEYGEPPVRFRAIGRYTGV